MRKRTVISIGNFDGVHHGHRAIVSTLKRLAEQHGDEVVILTFDPHPNAVLDPANQPPRLCTPQQKIERLRRAGADRIVVLEPKAEILSQPPEAFVENLVRTYRPRVIVEGGDFRFGRRRAGDIQLLNKMGGELGFRVEVQPDVDVMLSDLTLVTVRSSLIRWLIGQGRVEDAGRCLDEPFSLTGMVARGEQRGRTIGVPTVNLDLDLLNEYMLPADGVYAGYATWDGQGTPYPAAISVGNKPSFETNRLTIEAHLVGFEGDLYGQTITLAFTHWLRDQARFPDVQALRSQLDRDIQRAASVITMEPNAITR
ncbi:MAG: bifunctional riboflavin kinase/FAD synthetase [Phycisphaeraceae bacterium]